MRTSPGQKAIVAAMLVFVNLLFVVATVASEFRGLLRWLTVFSLIASVAVILQISRL